MKLHWLQHVQFEGLGYIEEWAISRGAEISCTRLFAGETLPDLERVDWLIVMGGPMGTYDHDDHPWLVAEKDFIRQAIEADKTVVGICLGAQLIADALGAKVYPGPQKEIGWFTIRRSEHAPHLIPEELTVFHWHGDTFDIPVGAVKLAASKLGINQGFAYGERSVGLQFHMETTPDSMDALIENCGHELIDAPSIQTADQLRDGISHIGNVNAAMKKLLDSLLK
ncbi:MAG: type 1 glutamine amidotransferase [Pontiella sp.]